MSQLLDRKALEARGITYTNPHLLKLEKAGRFPRRVRLTPYRVAWVEAEIDTWVEARIAARETPHELRIAVRETPHANRAPARVTEALPAPRERTPEEAAQQERARKAGRAGQAARRARSAAAAAANAE